ncbi:PREDICTED: cytochrome P450 72A14-like [Tarenaya hassleriana]|uniref:cytochrome P450 72A14-like n=1 Tax=Tarenaya hassleriana TaxID=28532 RepID=UPI0008FD5BDF|nr:PREDICTED: cytochrome P450 72A14-like [Tarenaya hassleriana]
MSLCRFMPTKTNKRIQEIDSEISDILKDIIRKREKDIENGEGLGDDLLGLLLESNSRPDQEHWMNIQEVIEECKLFYFAGQETTAVLLVWTMVLLGQHQEWQERAREEVLRVFDREKPDFDQLNHLKVVTMVLYEVLRLYPPLVAFNRANNKETKVGDITIPSGTVITLPVILIHRDTDLWGPDAAEFRPDRFAEGVSKATRNQAASFMPFGSGPRICIGQNFALTEARMAMAMFLQRFSFELSPSYAHSPHIAITLHPQFGAQLKLRRL